MYKRYNKRNTRKDKRNKKIRERNRYMCVCMYI